MNTLILLREASESDLPLMLAWRSNPLVYEGFIVQNEPLKWEEHYRWWHSKQTDFCFFVIMVYSDCVLRPVGVVNIKGFSQDSPEIGFYIGETSLWGQGVGKEAVRQALNYMRRWGKRFVKATVLDSNERSIRLLKSLGFSYMGASGERQSSLYRLEL